MIRSLLSRYRPQYIRSLIYMLQTSEYRIADFFSWYHRTRDFSAVEKRGTLRYTKKAFMLYMITWTLALGALTGAVWCVLQGTQGYIVAGTIILIAVPFALPYVIALPLLCIFVCVQKPIEYIRTRRAKKVLAAHRATKIAVAGSYGKTTMREIIKTVLSESKKVAAPPHSYNTPLGISTFVQTLTGDEEVLVFELGESHPGDVQKLCEWILPDIGVITGVNEAHLHTFGTLEQTAETIFALAKYLGNRPCYVNAENTLAREHAHSTHILYSRQGTNRLTVSDAHTGLDGTSFTFTQKNKAPLTCFSTLLGLHQVGPLMAAIDLALRLDVPRASISTAVARTRPFSHRLEPHEDETGVITLDDSYNGNPDGVRAVIEFLASLSGHRRFYVTPGLVEMGSRVKEVHEEIGKTLCEAKIEYVVLIRNSVTPHIAQGLQAAGYNGTVLWFEDAPAAFAAIPQMTVTGDVVLLQNDWPDQYK